MPSTIHPSPAAIEYAKAMLDLANAEKQAEAIGQELLQLRDLVIENPAVAALFADPSVGHIQRSGFIQRTFENRLSPTLYNLLGVLNKRRRLPLLGQIAQAYDQLLARQLNHVEVEVTTAQPIDEQMLAEIRQKVAAAFKKDPMIAQRVDESVIGGLVLRVEDSLIDASVRSQLQAMREQLAAAAPR